MRPLGIFGGTFDPIHCGHLRAGFELLQLLELAELRWMPSGTPAHRDTPLADAELRLRMVRAAVADQAGFTVDDREVRRGGKSYTVLTLEELRSELGEQPLCLILGMDAFVGLPGWHRWREILTLCHIIVAHRPGWQAPTSGELALLLEQRRVTEIHALHDLSAGALYIHPVTQLEISSTALRETLITGGDPCYLVPEPVRQIIRETGCYARR